MASPGPDADAASTAPAPAAAAAAAAAASAAAASPSAPDAQHPEATTPDPDTTTTPAPPSPPLPQKHTPVTPGPRAARFVDTYHAALARALARVNYDNFAACFPTVATYAPNALRNVQKQMVDYLDERCTKDFQLILEERDVIRKINELEALVSDADRRRREHPQDAPPPVPPHTLPPEAIIRAHLHPHLAQQHSHLGAALANTKLENEALFESVQAQRREMRDLLDALDAVVADVDAANALLAEVAPELAAEARAADIQMSGV